MSEKQSEKPYNGGFATNSVLTRIENEISDVSNLVKETDYDAK